MGQPREATGLKPGVRKGAGLEQLPWASAPLPDRSMGLAAAQGQGRVATCPLPSALRATRAGEAPSAAHWVCRPWWGWLALPPTVPEGKQLPPLLPMAAPPPFMASPVLRPSPHVLHSLRCLGGETSLCTEPGGRKGDLGPPQDLNVRCPTCAPQAVPRASGGTAASPSTTHSPPESSPHLLIFQTFEYRPWTAASKINWFHSHSTVI